MIESESDKRALFTGGIGDGIMAISAAGCADADGRVRVDLLKKFSTMRE
jgi:hypothetical protein